MQPLVARALLPEFGGSAMVWTLSMLFFQTGLVLGYAWADWSTRKLSPRVQRRLHAALLGVSLVWLPLAVGAAPETASPSVAVLVALLVTAGGPYVLLASNASLVQAWWARRVPGRNPYRLYALSNASALVALLGYPLVLEPQTGLAFQARLWSVGYCLFALLSVAAAWLGSGVSAAPPAQASPTPRSTRWLWLALPCCGSVVMLAATLELQARVAVVPLLWALPLALYLLTYTLAFDRPGWYRRGPVLALCALGLLPWLWDLPVDVELQGMELVVYWSAMVFLYCLACHGELYRLRPEPSQLTRFYLALSVGGAAGGVAVGLVAPQVFDHYAELPLGLAAALLTVAAAAWHQRAPGRPPRLVVGTALAAAAVALFNGWRLGENEYLLERARNFYGVITVTEEPIGEPAIPIRFVLHGHTIHGAQAPVGIMRYKALTYYGHGTPLETVMRNISGLGSLHVGVAGMGVGTVAVHLTRGDRIRFYEIDPLMVDIARRHFTYLADADAELTVVEGDARVSLAAEEPQQFDLLILDAFSGSAPPTHMLTREAFDLYARHLKPDGVLLVHISNTWLKLEHVVAAAALEHGGEAALLSSLEDEAHLTYNGDWILWTPTPGFLDLPELRQSARPTGLPGVEPFTDDRASLFPWIDW